MHALASAWSPAQGGAEDLDDLVEILPVAPSQVPLIKEGLAHFAGVRGVTVKIERPTPDVIAWAEANGEKSVLPPCEKYPWTLTTYVVRSGEARAEIVVDSRDA